MAPLMLLAVLVCLAVLRRRTRRCARPASTTTLLQISDPAVAHRALNKNADAFSDRPAGIFPVALATGRRGERNDTMITVNYGAHWRALRCNLTAKILHPSRLGSLSPLQLEATQGLVADLSARCAGGEVMAVRDQVNAAVFALVTRLCFGDGVDASHTRAMERVIHEFTVVVGELNPVFDGSTLSKLMNWRRLRQLFVFQVQQAELFLPLIEARRQRQPRSQCCRGGIVPYVDSLIDLRVPDDDAAIAGGSKHGAACWRELRDNEMVSLVSEFLSAGTGSVVACLEWTLAHLVVNTAVQDKLRREIDGEGDGAVPITSKRLRDMPYLNAVVLESLRMHPPVAFVLRGVHGEGAAAAAVGATTTADGGLKVQFILGDIGRDRKSWKDPDDFRPERFLAGGEAEGVGPLPGPKEIRMMPFGAAHRHCPGMTLGLLHIKCFLAALVREFEWAPAEECGVDLTELDAFFKVMKKPLLARVTPRTFAA